MSQKYVLSSILDENLVEKYEMYLTKNNETIIEDLTRKMKQDFCRQSSIINRQHMSIDRIDEILNLNVEMR